MATVASLDVVHLALRLLLLPPSQAPVPPPAPMAAVGMTLVARPAIPKALMAAVVPNMVTVALLTDIVHQQMDAKTDVPVHRSLHQEEVV